MIKFKNILSEGYGLENEYEVKLPYIRVFNILSKNNIKGDDIKGAFNFIKNNIGVPNHENSIIVTLYNKNYRPDGEYNNIKEDQWIIPSDMEKDEWERALGEYFDVSPFMFEKSIFGKRYYNPLIDLYLENTNTPTRLISEVQIFRYETIVDEARQQIIDRIDNEGWEYFSSSYLEDYVVVNMDTAEYNAEQMVEEEWNNYLNKKGDLKLTTKESMIEELGLVDEYFYWKEDIEEYKNDIIELQKEKQTLEFKSEKIYKEISNISLHIETLSDTVDYGDDEQEYYSMYSGDIEELTNKLNRYESIYEEINSDIDFIDSQINELTGYLDDLYLDFEIYDNDNKFKSLYKEKRMEQILNDIEDDPLQYIWDSGLDITEAIGENLISLDEDLVISAAIEGDGPAYFLNLEGVYTDEFDYQDIYYFIIID
jgi:prefoldin subunit 5